MKGQKIRQGLKTAEEDVRVSPMLRARTLRAMRESGKPKTGRVKKKASFVLAAALAWLFAESVLQARPIPALTKALRTALPLAVLAGICYNFCVYFAAEPQLMGQNPALYENVSRLVQFWL